ncbi:hypothetical protein QBC43DRAFT_356528 [Cladorrhinum sp. PSN259]|nr:hypothetical protein QBC43DRAFT_356528 [Cladorrhinum sp. PSN259]
MSTSTYRLAPWDQAAMRGYMSVALCFPRDPADRLTAESDIQTHIIHSLDNLSYQRPDFAGKLHVGQGKDDESTVYLKITTGDTVPFSRLNVPFSKSYSELERDEFPAANFVNPEFTISAPLEVGDNPVPVAQLRILFIEGGFILFVHLHHSYADGVAFSTFLELLGESTCRDYPLECLPETRPIYTFDILIHCDFDIFSTQELATISNNPKLAEDLLAKCPEYCFNDAENPSGPTQATFPPRHPGQTIGRTFILDTDKLDALCAKSATGRVSRFFVLSALAWAHTTSARIASCLPQDRNLYTLNLPTFWNPAHWGSKGLFSGNESLNSYYGNAVAIPVTVIPNPQTLVYACDDPSTVLAVAQEIQRANQTVDEEYVSTRTKLFCAMPDIRRLGLGLDSNPPQNFSVNTWGFLGKKAKWKFPEQLLDEDSSADGGTAAPAVRRVQGRWSYFPHALALPSRPGVKKSEMELVVTLPEVAMEILLKDEAWMWFVNRTTQ